MAGVISRSNSSNSLSNWAFNWARSFWMAVICSTDARYADVVPKLAAALDEAGARTVIVAGRPGEHEEAWRAAGVDGFIHMGCDQLRILTDLLREEGVLHV